MLVRTRQVLVRTSKVGVRVSYRFQRRSLSRIEDELNTCEFELMRILNEMRTI